MYLDSALNYCSARTTINNYLVRWCLLLFHFSLEANMCANLVSEILRAPEERVSVAGAQRRFQPSADSLPCSAVRVLGSCIPTPPFSNYTFFFLHHSARSSYYDSLQSSSHVCKQTEIIQLKEPSAALGVTPGPADDHREQEILLAVSTPSTSA